MPKRQSVRKYGTEEVQGEDSFVILSGVKVKEIRRARKESNDPKFDEFEAGIGLLSTHILQWNWVDDEGNQLPLPKKDPGVIDELTNEETVLLVDLMMGESESKN